MAYNFGDMFLLEALCVVQTGSLQPGQAFARHLQNRKWDRKEEEGLSFYCLFQYKD